MARNRWQFHLSFMIVLMTASSFALGIGAWIGYSVAVEILATLGVILLVAAIPLAILAILMLIIIYAPSNPFARPSHRPPPPHQFDARDHG